MGCILSKRLQVSIHLSPIISQTDSSNHVFFTKTDQTGSGISNFSMEKNSGFHFYSGIGKYLAGIDKINQEFGKSLLLKSQYYDWIYIASIFTYIFTFSCTFTFSFVFNFTFIFCWIILGEKSSSCSNVKTGGEDPVENLQVCFDFTFSKTM